MVSSSVPIRAVIFDFGGVLTTPGRVALTAWVEQERIQPELVSAALKEWLSRKAPPGTPLHLLETGELEVEEFNKILAQRLRTLDDEPVAPEGLLSRLFSNMFLNPPMLQLVRDIRDHGVRTVMLSNSWGNHYPWEDIDGLFEFAIISGDVGLRKPDPRIYQMTLERLGLEAPETVFIDDGAPNIAAASELGMRTVEHENAKNTRHRLAELLPDLPPTVEEKP